MIGLALSRRWATTAEIAEVCGCKQRHVRKVLERLRAAGLVDHAKHGQGGAGVWRLAYRATTPIGGWR